MRKIVPDVVSSQVLTILSPEATVRETAQIMAQRKIGAVMIASAGRLAGVFTERDMTGRVVAPGLDPDTTRLATVMTRDPITILPDCDALDALAMMRQRNFRHLPVVDPVGRIVGMLSIRDLYAAVQKELEHDLHQQEAYIYGSGYSLGA